MCLCGPVYIFWAVMCGLVGFKHCASDEEVTLQPQSVKYCFLKLLVEGSSLWMGYFYYQEAFTEKAACLNPEAGAFELLSKALTHIGCLFRVLF